MRVTKSTDDYQTLYEIQTALTSKVHGALLAPPRRHHLDPHLPPPLPVGAWTLHLISAHPTIVKVKHRRHRGSSRMRGPG